MTRSTTRFIALTVLVACAWLAAPGAVSAAGDLAA